MGIELSEKPRSLSMYYSKEAGDVESKVNFEAIAELQEPLGKILEQIGSENFDLIIGDDASGRIPTLILSRFFRTKAKKEDKKTPQTIFIAGGTKGISKEKRETVINEKKEKIAQLLKEEKEKIGNIIEHPHVLIVTDTLYTGDTLRPLIEALKEQGFYVRVATIGLMGDEPSLESTEKTKKRLEKLFDLNITYGTMHVPSIWSKHKLGGVIRKEDKSEIYSRPIKKFKSFTEKEAAEIQKTINPSREDANIIADRLIEKFLKN